MSKDKEIEQLREYKRIVSAAYILSSENIRFLNDNATLQSENKRLREENERLRHDLANRGTLIKGLLEGKRDNENRGAKVNEYGKRAAKIMKTRNLRDCRMSEINDEAKNEIMKESEPPQSRASVQNAIYEAAYRLAVEDLRLKGERILSIRKGVER